MINYAGNDDITGIYIYIYFYLHTINAIPWIPTVCDHFRLSPSQPENKLSVGQFCEEFSSFLEDKVLSASRKCIVGDYNFPVDDLKNSDTQSFHKLLHTFDFLQM